MDVRNAMESCETCGMPLETRERLRWDERGMFTRRPPFTRLVAVEHSEISGLLEQVGASFPGDLASRLRELGRVETRREIEARLGSFKRGMLRRFAAKGALEELFENAAGYGVAKMDIRDMKPPRHMHARFRRPFDINVCAGALQGVWEGLFDIMPQLVITEAGVQTWDVKLDATSKEAAEPLEEAARDRVKKPKLGRKSRCRSCGSKLFSLPHASKTLEGTVFGPERGYWVLLPAGMLTAILALAQEGDPAMLPELKSVSRKQAAANLAGVLGTSECETDVATQAYLDNLVATGWAAGIRMSSHGYLMQFDIDTPIAPFLVAGKLEALYEWANRSRSDSEVLVMGADRTRITVGPHIAAPVMNIGSVLGRYPYLRNYPASFIPF
ncbi:MAG: hypothetical protein ACYC55_00010 [Candidatus Geothermincolia bacterium]